MIRQYDAQRMCDDALKKHGLWANKWKTTFTKSESFLGQCNHTSKRIVLNTIFLNGCEIHELEETIKHEIAHALVGPEHGHDSVWEAKAIEIGLEKPRPCGNIRFDKARSMEVKQETIVLDGAEIQKTLFRKPKRAFHRINKVCPICGKAAVEVLTTVMNNVIWSKLECGHITKKDQIKSEGFDLHSWTSKSGKKLYPYQIEGIEFVERAGGRVLIADEPGLGKTPQALGFMYAHKDTVTPVLWVGKQTLRLQALKEALDWCGPEFMAQIIYSPRHMIMPGLKLYIISMDLLRNMPTEKLEMIKPKLIVADEIQHFKNPDSTRTAELRKLVAMDSVEYFLPLSGTPWKNRGQEYYPVLNMLDPQKFQSYKKFKYDWVDWYTDKTTGKIRQGGIRNIPKFREYTKDLIIRRLRDDVLPDLPKINRTVRFIDMEDLYAKAYDKAEEKVAAIIKAAMIDGKSPQFLGGQLMQLKHITGLAKVQSCIEDVEQFLEQTDDFEKITVFHHHIDVGDRLQKGDHETGDYEGLDKWLVENGYNKSLRLFGGRGPTERDDIIGNFKNDIKNRVLIASTLASGEGLNIQFCQNAYMLERQWNPGNEEQAELRFSRPLTEGDLPDYLKHLVGRTKSITVPYYIADGTVDSMLTSMVEEKRVNFRKTMNDKDATITYDEQDIIMRLAEMIIKKRYGAS